MHRPTWDTESRDLMYASLYHTKAVVTSSLLQLMFKTLRQDL